MNTITCDRCKNSTSSSKSLSLCLDDQRIDLCFNCVRFLPSEMRNQLPRPYRVTFTHRVITVMARTQPEAIRSAQELAGPDAKFISCMQEGEW